MNLSPQQLEQFDGEGYLFFPSLFTADEIKVLNSHKLGVLENGTPNDELKAA